MKIKPEDYAVLRAAVAPLDGPEKRGSYMAQGLSARRYRWDLLWQSRLKIGDGRGAPGTLNLYAYLNDDHIDTALRKIVCDDDWRDAPVTPPAAEVPAPVSCPHCGKPI